MPRGPAQHVIAPPNALIVYNLVGTSRRKCRCSYGTKSWLHHWSRKTGLPRPVKCCVRGCARFTQVGAHVRVQGSDGRIPWILPVCQRHNKRPSAQPMVIKHGYRPCVASMSDCL